MYIMYICVVPALNQFLCRTILQRRSKMPLSDGEGVTKVLDPQHSQKLLRVLRTFWQEQSFHDALLVVGEEELPVQKNILAAASPYIRSV